MKFKILLLLICISFQSFVLKADIKIYSKIAVDSDTVQFGKCIVGDYLESVFVIENNSAIEVKIAEVYPSYYLGTPDNVSNNEFQEFALFTTSLHNSIIPRNSKREFTIRYNANPELSVYPLGSKTAALKIGVFNAAYSTPPTNISELEKFRAFIIKASKTDLEIDFTRNLFLLDTVCIYPSIPLELTTYMQNMIRQPQSIVKENFSYLATNVFDTEIKRIDNDQTTEFDNYQDKKERRFIYYPVNRDWDTAIYTVQYKRNEAFSSEESASIIIIAYGAEQRLKLVDAIGGKINSDTIDFGDVRIGNIGSLKVIVKNLGNLPFGVLSQAILKEQLDDNEEAYIFDKFLLGGGKHLKPSGLDTFEISFIPTKINTTVGRLVLYSDIANRKITNINNESRKIVFYVKGRGVAPEIQVNNPEIDFGSVIMSELCPITKDSSIVIYNSGNKPLRISEIRIDPPVGVPFEFSNTEIIIRPAEAYKFPIRFNSKWVEPGKIYEANIYFINNSLAEKQEFPVTVKASTEYLRQFQVSIPKNVKAKTGREVRIPILIDRNLISTATSANLTISYDKTMLRYKAYHKINTASEAAWDIRIDNSQINTLGLNISLTPSNFKANDTLIVLAFDTFLGENISTPIVIENLKIGNQNCDQIFSYDLAEANGYFRIDSICGLSLKTIKPSDNSFRINSIYPNPSSSFTAIDFKIPFPNRVTVEILNNTGAVIDLLLDENLDAGGYTLTYNLNKLGVGNYLCRIKYADDIEMIKLSVVR